MGFCGWQATTGPCCGRYFSDFVGQRRFTVDAADGKGQPLDPLEDGTVEKKKEKEKEKEKEIEREMCKRLCSWISSIVSVLSVSFWSL